MSKLAKNIAHLRKLRGFSQEQFADELEIKKSRLGAYEENRAVPPLDLLIKISDYFKLPIDVLVRNDLSKSIEIPSIQIGKQRILFPITVNGENDDMIEIVPVKASAGYLTGYGDPDFIENLPKMMFPLLGKSGKLRAFPIKGDSMPPLSDGSFVIARFVENPKYIKAGTACIVLTKDDGLAYKRWFPDQKNKNLVHLHSDNPYYKPYSVHFNQILELWEYTAAIQTGNLGNPPTKDSVIIAAIADLKKEIEIIKNNSQSS